MDTTRMVPGASSHGGGDSGGTCGSSNRGGDLASLAALAAQDLSALLALATAKNTNHGHSAPAGATLTNTTSGSSSVSEASGGRGGAGLAAEDTTLLAALASQDPSTLAAVAMMIAQKNSNNQQQSQQQSQQQAHFLPSSAPVSSLLPSMVPPAAPPAVQQQHQQQAVNPMSLQALMTLIGASTSAAPTSASALLPPPNAAQHPAVVASSFPTIPTAAPPPLFQHHPSTSRATAVVVPSTLPSSSGTSNQYAPLSLLQDKQKFTLPQLQQQAQRLQEQNQPIPPALTMLLTELQRKELQKNAKRAANRKSASTSRARKKALVQEMTDLNQQLKRQALILSLLPDLVIVIDPHDAVISFCSAQVENVLRGHTVDDLVGTRLTDLLVPASQTKLLLLIQQLVASLKSKTTGAEQRAMKRKNKDQAAAAAPSDLGEEDAPTADSTGDRVAVTADSSSMFPLSVVNVDSHKTTITDTTTTNQLVGGMLDENENSDKEPSSLTASAEIDHSDNSVKEPLAPPAAEDSALEGVMDSDDGDGKATSGNTKHASAKKKKNYSSKNEVAPSSDDSNSNSLSTVQKANANLGRNVRWHNKKMKSSQTANNATARLSSLQHRPESLSSAEDDEDDSGYRESNDSREEETSSSSSSSAAASDDDDDSAGRCKPMAPTCNICLIRKDLTTIWCEVTSSIRTKQAGEDSAEAFSQELSALKSTTPGAKSSMSSSSKMEDNESKIPASASQVGSVELLLCLRPVRDGDKIVDRKVRAGHDVKHHQAPKVVSESSNVGPSSGEASENPGPAPAVPKHRRKRGRSANKTGLASKRRRKEAPPLLHIPQISEQSVAEVDTTAVESLLLMNKVLK